MTKNQQVDTPMVITRELSARMANMGIVCSFLIVWNHLNPKVTMGAWLWWVDGILGGQGLSAIAVPYFFLASGFFLSAHLDEEGYWGKEIKKRIRSLLVPYVIWNVLYFLFYTVMLIGMNAVSHRDLGANFDGGLIRLLKVAGVYWFSQPEAGHLWYVRSLLFFVLIVPVLKRLMNLPGLVLVMALYGLIAPWTTAVDGSWKIIFRWFFSLEGLFYFTLGMYLRRAGMHGFNNIWMSCLAFAVGLGLFALSIFGVQRGWCYGYYFRWIGIPVAVIGVWGLMPKVRLPKCLVDNSFPIYLLHIMLLLQLSQHMRLCV